MSDWWRILFAVLIWPGLLGGALLGWLLLWSTRKIMARLQGRKGASVLSAFLRFCQTHGQENNFAPGNEPHYF